MNTDGNCACDVCGAAMHTWADHTDGSRKCSVCDAVCGDAATAHTDADHNCVCDVCGGAMSHKDEDYDCVCDVCGASITHVDREGGGEDGLSPDCRCDNCGVDITHVDADVNCVCDVCGKPCHSWAEISTGYYQCAKCSLTCGDSAHPHQWADEYGLNLGKCWSCGYECSHDSFVDGKCAVCQFDPFNTGVMTLDATPGTPVGTVWELKAAVSNSGDYYLTAPITMIEDLTVPADKVISLNLMDKSIDAAGYTLTVPGTLTITGTTGSITSLQSVGTTTINGGTVGSISATSGSVTVGADGVIGENTLTATVATLTGDASLTVSGTIKGLISTAGSSTVTFSGGTYKSRSADKLYRNAKNEINLASGTELSVLSAQMSEITSGASGSLNVLFTASGASVSFPFGALGAVKAAMPAAGDGSATFSVVKSGSVYTLKVLQGGTELAPSFAGSPVTVRLFDSAGVKEIIHKTGDTVNEVFYPAANVNPDSDKSKAFTIDGTDAVLDLTHFSSLTAGTAPTLLPKVNETTLTGYAGVAYTEANTPLTMTVTNSGTISAISTLPTGVTATTNKTKLLTTAATTAATTALTVTAINEYGTSTNAVSLVLQDTVALVTIKNSDGTVASTTAYGTMAAAVAFANNPTPTLTTGQTVTLTVCKDDASAIGVTRTMTLDGQGHTVGAITVTGGSTVAPVLTDVKTSAVTVSGGGTTTIGGSATEVATVTATSASATRGATGNSTVNITGGKYTTLRGNNYKISGGNFPSEPAKADMKNVGGKYYIATKNASNTYDVSEFTPDITGVDHNGYHYRSSTNKTTLTFTTNIPTAYYDSGDITGVAYIRDSDGSISGPTTLGYTINEPTGGNISITVGYSRLNALTTGDWHFRLDTKYNSDPTHPFEIGTTVKTGDTSNIALWAAIMGGSVLILGGVAFYLIRKSKKSGGKKKTDGTEK